MSLSVLGAAYGIAKSGIGISAVSILRPDMMVRSSYPPGFPDAPYSPDLLLVPPLLILHSTDLMPPILASILAIYGLVVSIIISTSLKERSALHTNFMQLAAGLSVGLSCLSAGFCIGIIGDAGVRATGQQPRMYVGMTMMLIFSEVLAIYGLIVGLWLLTRAEIDVTNCSLD